MKMRKVKVKKGAKSVGEELYGKTGRLASMEIQTDVIRDGYYIVKFGKCVRMILANDLEFLE